MWKMSTSGIENRQSRRQFFLGDSSRLRTSALFCLLLDRRGSQDTEARKKEDINPEFKEEKEKEGEKHTVKSAGRHGLSARLSFPITVSHAGTLD